ncbi:hypothetical protein B5M09_004498 [Aphanomyces astaci]|uniref:Uncharacterized protein n=1 Tax=Aphanomyces astaci TaxID=112090 RepID=A0A3R7YDI8_APHAT|nr:hypothetical protein B5M09_004498 [Aphanomyces astaci]
MTILRVPTPLPPSSTKEMKQRTSFKPLKSLASVHWTRLRLWAASKNPIHLTASAATLASSTSLLLDDTDTDDDLTTDFVRPRGRSDPGPPRKQTKLFAAWRTGSREARHSTPSCCM